MGNMGVDGLLNLIIWYPVFVFSTTVHEAAHAWAALRGGDRTAYEGGQVSLDPTPHIRREPFGMILMPLLAGIWSSGGYMLGWASTPYDIYWAQRHPKRAALMSLAGPGANLLLVLIAALAIHGCIAAGVMMPPAALNFTHVVDPATPAWAFPATVLSMLFSLNLLLAVFNLIPVPPLDGSGALPLFLTDAATERYRQLMHSSGLGWIGLLVAFWAFDPIFRPIYNVAISALYPGLQYR